MSKALAARTDRLRALMADAGVDVFILAALESYNGESMAYLSGFTGSAGALAVSADRQILIADGRYSAQAAEQSPFEIVPSGGTPLIQKLAEILKEGGWRRGGFEGDRLSVSAFGTLEPSLPAWKNCPGFLHELRRKKDAAEVAAIRTSAEIAYRSYVRALEEVREGMTEKEFNALLEYLLRKNGADGGWRGSGFIVASGERGALPHGAPTDRPFQKGDIVTVDFGATVNGYASDITRNFSIGPLSPQGRDIQSALIEAHKRAADALRPGLEGREADAAARDVLTARGWGANFTHGLGHGLGLEVHEAPRLSPLSTDVLQEGDVVTVEPGIYIEGWGGMRIEDDYLITAGGAVCLSGALGLEAPAL